MRGAGGLTPLPPRFGLLQTLLSIVAFNFAYCTTILSVVKNRFYPAREAKSGIVMPRKSDIL